MASTRSLVDHRVSPSHPQTSKGNWSIAPITIMTPPSQAGFGAEMDANKEAIPPNTNPHTQIGKLPDWCQREQDEHPDG